jgi:thiol-disulfide isomerase/thioredoxin
VTRVAGPARGLGAPAILLGLLVALAGCGAPAAGSSAPELVGRTIVIENAAQLREGAPALSLPALMDGKSRILVNFWASWCVPCRDEIPLLAQYAHGSGATASLVGVLYRDAPGPAAVAASSLGADWPTLVDGSGAIAAQVPVNAAPLTLLLDARGVVIDYQVGAFADLAAIRAFVAAP